MKAALMFVINAKKVLVRGRVGEVLLPIWETAFFNMGIC